ncbi:hypothetical protein D7V97_27790 [Corallococcus sp. CA053C]|uniref:hypothetical protein n=1 Tax=Corallococcus sp. CA053C TaxID=2316732 RepID=UPI000EA26101|nr:hypothetical protein [Corallococcus sp. CA053C]RKH02543.1 hypothetical protein D7V97_27790 [Corallococcus sp. CA053C]
MRSPLLLLGSLLLLTPACGVDDIAITQRTPVESILMTATESHSERRVHIVARAKPDTEAKLSLLSIHFNAQPNWLQSESGGSEVLPWFRVRLVDERDGQVVQERSTVVEDVASPETLDLGPAVNTEDEVALFEGTYRIEFDRQGPPSGGTVHVLWGAVTEVQTDGDHPERVEVLMTKPSGASAP